MSFLKPSFITSQSEKRLKCWGRERDREREREKLLQQSGSISEERAFVIMQK